MTDNQNLLTLTPGEKQELERWAQSRTLPAGAVFRARLLLALAEGQSYREIEKSLGTSAPTIARWRTRFEQDGLAGLKGLHKGSRPRVATAAVQARVVRRTQQKPGDGSTQKTAIQALDRLDPLLPLPAVRNAMVSNITVTARCRSTRRWM